MKYAQVAYVNMIQEKEGLNKYSTWFGQMETDSEQCAVQSRHLAGGTAAACMEQQSPQQELSTKPAQGTAGPKPGSHLRRNKQTDPNEQTNKQNPHNRSKSYSCIFIWTFSSDSYQATAFMMHTFTKYNIGHYDRSELRSF